MDRPAKSLADYVAIAISPVLIMALVGSLVFFLLAILYVGQHGSSLRWILFFFVFGAVLVARISMTAGIEDRAGLYGFILGLLTWLALLRYVEYTPGTPMADWGWAINLGLIALIWWSAHRLTWDCTLIDDGVDASGAGLLEATGLDKGTDAPLPAPPAEGSGERKKKQHEPGGFDGWMQRYRHYSDQRRKRPHTPGTWVVYFSLTALPLFGLGQTLIPLDDDERRGYAFRLMCIYTGSGLGLLLTTSFLGLRRYLRQRNLRMPAAMTGTWLTVGGLLIAAVLIFGAFLPRPGATHPLLQWTGVGSKERSTSRLARVGDAKEKKKDEEASRTEKTKDKGPDSKDGDNKKGKPGDKSGEGQKDKGEGKKGDSDQKKDSREGEHPKKQDDKSKSASGKAPDKEKSSQDKGASKQEESSQTTSSPPPPNVGGFLSQLAPILKWIVIGVLALVIAFLVLRSGLRFLANFTLWAQRLLAAIQAWWQGLGALWQRQRSDEEGSSMPPAPPRPFAAFADPFLTGRAERLSPGELVRYTFAALEAWALERDLGRQRQETPLEFAQRLGDEIPALEKNARRLAGFYASLAYAQGTIGNGCREPLHEFWLLLAEVVERPLVCRRDAS